METALQNGEIQAAWSTFNTADIPRLEADSNLQYIQKPGLYDHYILFNHNNPILNKTLVRQAIAYALNYSALAATENGKRACSAFGCNSYSANVSLSFTYDPSKARALLAQAGYSNGISQALTLYYVSDVYGPSEGDRAAIIQSNLKDVGITVTIFGATLTTELHNLDQGIGDITLFLVGAVIPDPGFFATAFYSTGGIITTYDRWTPNSTANQLVTEIGVALDPSNRTQLLLQLQRTFDPEVHNIFVYNPADYVFYRKGVSGIVLTNVVVRPQVDFSYMPNLDIS